MEKRRRQRTIRRIPVRFGEKDFGYTGVTRDISANGAFIVTPVSLTLGTRLHMELMVPERSAFVEAVVRRVFKVPPAMQSQEVCGFGVSFVHLDDLIAGVASSAAATHFPVDFTSREALVKAQAQEFRRGGLFLSTDRELPAGSPVVVELHLAFAGARLELEATVVHTISTGARGLMVTFTDPHAVEAKLAPFLA